MTGTLCDRNSCLGKRLFPPQSSLPPDKVSGWTPPTKRTAHNFSISHQDTILFRSSSPLGRRPTHTSFHSNNDAAFKDLQLTPAVNVRGSSHSIPRPHPPFNAFQSPIIPTCSSRLAVPPYQTYTTAGKENFITPVKGKSMAKKPAVCPSVWSSRQGQPSHQQQQQNRRARPVWLSSTPKAACVSSGFRPSNSDRSGSSSSSEASHFQLTLSQIHEMEESQKELELDGNGQPLKVTIPPPKVPEDSGYTSCEISTLKSPPSPRVSSPPPPHISSSSSDPLQVEATNEEDLTDIIFAEVAMEDLDSLGHTSSSCDLDPPTLSLTLSPVLYPTSFSTKSESPSKDNTSDSPMDASSKVCSPARVLTVPAEQVMLNESLTNVPCREPQARAGVSSGVVKPRCGFLLDLRRQHINDRIPLQEAVRGQLPRSAVFRGLTLHSVSDVLRNISSETVEHFRFSSEYFSSNVLQDDSSSVLVGDGAFLRLNRGGAGLEEFWIAFKNSPGVDEALISHDWFVNHFKHLVVKLAAMERSYPLRFSHCSLTPDWLMLQLKYRYDREIDRAERSAIHRMCEHDDIPSRRVVLYVSKVYDIPVGCGNDSGLTTPASGVSWNGQGNTIEDETLMEKKQEQQQQPSVDLSDGWYDLPCLLDGPLSHMIKMRHIRVGTKLMVYGAELIGLGSPCHPLDAPPSCCLKLSANSTRRARWDTRLGYQRVPTPFLVSLDSLFPDGGLVGMVTAVVARVYPMVYMEKKEGTKSVMRCARLEERERASWERQRERLVDDICSRVKREYEMEVAQQGMVVSEGVLKIDLLVCVF